MMATGSPLCFPYNSSLWANCTDSQLLFCFLLESKDSEVALNTWTRSRQLILTQFNFKLNIFPDDPAMKPTHEHGWIKCKCTKRIHKPSAKRTLSNYTEMPKKAKPVREKWTQNREIAQNWVWSFGFRCSTLLTASRIVGILMGNSAFRS